MDRASSVTVREVARVRLNRFALGLCRGVCFTGVLPGCFHFLFLSGVEVFFFTFLSLILYITLKQLLVREITLAGSYMRKKRALDLVIT